MEPIRAIVLGAGRRGTDAYAPYALKNPDELQIVGVADPSDIRREHMRRQHNIPEENCYVSWQACLQRQKFADAVFICTQDQMHFEPAMKAIEAGYDILLEKPIAPTARECFLIEQAARKAGVRILVCHVLRYANHYRKIKELVDSGLIGEIVHINHIEAVGDYHQAHSYVRGNWNNSETSSPMILAKSCHDMDLLRWIIGKKCTRLSSFGSLKYFNGAHMPQGAPSRCTDGCPHSAECPYDAVKVYCSPDTSYWFQSAATGDPNPTQEKLMEAVRTGPYGRCVFQCDNNVVDHMVVNLEFEGEVTVAFTMAAFTPAIEREMTIMGTKGYLRGSLEQEKIWVTDFLTKRTEEIDTRNGQFGHIGHGGGDEGLVRDFVRVLRGEETGDRVTEIGISCESHMIAFAAEESRIRGSVVEMETFMRGQTDVVN